MTPKKNLIDVARADGSIARLNQLLSAAHILLCVSNDYIEEAADLMKSKGLLIGELKKLHNNFLLHADRYFKEFASMVDDSKLDMFSDMESFDKVFRQWNNIPKEWKPKAIENELEELKNK